MRHYESADERRLAEQLRDAAPSPGFSPALHARIMQAVERNAVDEPVVVARFGWMRLAGLAAVAGIAVMVGVMLLNSIDGSVQNIEVAQTRLPTIPVPAVDTLVAEVASTAGTSLQAKFGNLQMAYLDEDAQAFGAFVLNRLQVVEP